MQITPSDHGDTRILALNGRLDATSCTLFEEACRQELNGTQSNIIIHLGALEYMSSAGLRAILAMEKLARQLGKTLLFCAMQPMVADIFRVSGFDRILHIAPTQETALATLEKR